MLDKSFENEFFTVLGFGRFWTACSSPFAARNRPQFTAEISCILQEVNALLLNKKYDANWVLLWIYTRHIQPELYMLLLYRGLFAFQTRMRQFPAGGLRWWFSSVFLYVRRCCCYFPRLFGLKFAFLPISLVFFSLCAVAFNSVTILRVSCATPTGEFAVVYIYWQTGAVTQIDSLLYSEKS